MRRASPICLYLLRAEVILLCTAMTGCRLPSSHHHHVSESVSSPTVSEFSTTEPQAAQSGGEKKVETDSSFVPHVPSKQVSTHSEPLLNDSAQKLKRLPDGTADQTRDLHSEPVHCDLCDIENVFAGTGVNDRICGCRCATPMQSSSSLPGWVWNDHYRKMWDRLGDDAGGLANWENAALLGTALGGAIALRQDLDGEVRADVIRHPGRWGGFGEGLGNVGDARIQFPALLALYGYSLKRGDRELRDVSGTMLSAVTLTGIGTLAIKAIANTDRPSPEWNGGQFGFPSSHASSSFAIAAVLEEFYGFGAGLPAYAVAGMVGWSRIDERDHDLSDVVFGSALGFVIGKSVARKRLYGDSRAMILPYVHPTDGASGIMLDIPY